MAHFPFECSREIVWASGTCPSNRCEKAGLSNRLQSMAATPQRRASPPLTHIFSVYSLFLRKVLRATWVPYYWLQVPTEGSDFLTFKSILSPYPKQIFATNFVSIRTLPTHMFKLHCDRQAWVVDWGLLDLCLVPWEVCLLWWKPEKMFFFINNKANGKKTLLMAACHECWGNWCHTGCSKYRKRKLKLTLRKFKGSSYCIEWEVDSMSCL